MIHLLMLAKKGSSSYELELNNIEDLNGTNEKETNKNKSDSIKRGKHFTSYQIGIIYNLSSDF